MVENHKVILAGGIITEDGEVKGKKKKVIERSKTQNTAAGKVAVRLEQYQSRMIECYI